MRGEAAEDVWSGHDLGHVHFDMRPLPLGRPIYRGHIFAAARPSYALSAEFCWLVMKRAAEPDSLLIHAYVLWAYGENGMGWNMGPRP